MRMNKGEFLCPGFIDTHTHAPQFPNVGYGQQFELLDWLKEVTFPTEAKVRRFIPSLTSCVDAAFAQFADAKYAKKTYDDVVRRVINSGTSQSSPSLRSSLPS